MAHTSYFSTCFVLDNNKKYFKGKKWLNIEEKQQTLKISTKSVILTITAY